MDDNSKEIGQAKQETESQKPLNVLLVEDEPLVASLVKTVLAGHNLTVFETAEEALETLRKAKEAGVSFDWLITDRGLKGQMDGFDLVATIKSDELGSPYVTMVSGRAEAIRNENPGDQLRDKGIHQLMGKPFNIKEMMGSVNVAREFGRQSKSPQT